MASPPNTERPRAYALLSCVGVGLIACYLSFRYSQESHRFGIFSIVPTNNGVDIQILSGDRVLVHGNLGISFPTTLHPEITVKNASHVTVEWGDYARVTMEQASSPACIKVHWTSRFAREIQDCYELSQTHWYGGGETHTQVWPIETNPRNESPFVTGDFIQDPMINYGGVLESYWVLSNGAAVHITPNTPLFFSLNTSRPNQACFTARDRPPYTQRSPLTLTYEWCVADNVREAHKLASRIFFSTPERSVDELMLVRPLWSTWAQFKEHVNSTIVVQFARTIVERGFANSSHIEIDDNWESCYGEEGFNIQKFPNPKAMVDEIKTLNLRVTAWVHPFVNYECPMFGEGLRNGYFVKDAKGQTGLSRWWQGANAGVIDVTNQHGMFWWTERLEKLQKQTGLDSFKFDAGETFWLPGSAVLSGDDTLWPNVYSTKYVETCAKFGGLVETRVAHQTQKHGVFVRMLDKDSRWGHDNGLRSLIPTLLQFGIVGYPFVLPDMIGGNAYGVTPSKELYIRWMQANIFFPAVQFSIVPWTFDDETVSICLSVLSKREAYKQEILDAASQAVSHGFPINRPIWWVDPYDQQTFTIDDAYMLGDVILVAPVLSEGATSRDIYLPAGTWRSGVDSRVFAGPQWLTNYPAPLNTVPFFVKIQWK